MCLTTVKEIYETPSTLIVDGWKEFDGSGKNIFFQNFPFNRRREVPLDKWLVAEVNLSTDSSTDSSTDRGVIRSDDGKEYPAGFHVYADELELKKQGRMERYRRVFVRKVSSFGTQGDLHVVIASEMYVPSEPNGWPPRPSQDTFDHSLFSRFKGVKAGEA
jgi:hypothetical protein